MILTILHDKSNIAFIADRNFDRKVIKNIYEKEKNSTVYRIM